MPRQSPSSLTWPLPGSSAWQAFHEGVVKAFVEYQVPTIELIKATPKEAVCQVFEKVNTGGVSLTVFELLTATYAADDFNLREDWEKRRIAFNDHAVLDKVEETDFLQIVTLLATHDRRNAHLGAQVGEDKAPAVSCKRRDVLRLELDDCEKWADKATDGLIRVVRRRRGRSPTCGAGIRRGRRALGRRLPPAPNRMTRERPVVSP